MTRFTTILSALTLSLAASTTMADRVNVSSHGSVAQSVERLTQAVEAAGARIFNTIDFAAGNASVGQELRPTTLVIFGSPKIGASALQTGQTMALNLPLRVLFYEDANGQTWAMYDDPTTIAPSHGIAADYPAVLKMQAALERFTAIAAGQTGE